jgi:hypothetical protein
MAFFDVVARFLFADGGLSAGLAKANAQIAGFAKATPNARQGLKGLELGMRQAAVQAIGLSGPMGNVASSLVRIGGGSALILGAAAGIGLIGGAYRLASNEANRFVEENEKAAESFRRIAAAGSALTTLGQQLREARGELSVTEQRLEHVRDFRGGMFAGAGVIAGLFGPSRDVEEIRLQQLQATQRNTVLQASRQWEDAVAEAIKKGTKKGLEEGGPLWDQAIARLEQRLFQQRLGRGLAESQARLVAAGAGGFALRGGPPQMQALGAAPSGAGIPDYLTRGAEINQLIAASVTPAQQFASQVALLQEAIVATKDPTGELRVALEALQRSARQAGRAAQLGAAQMVTAFSSLVAGIVSGGGGPGGILQGLGGTLGLIGGINPIIPAALGGLGAIFSAFDSNEDRRHRELVTTINQSADRIRGEPQTITLVLTTPSGEEVDRVLYELGRRSRRDAVVRLPTG